MLIPTAAALLLLTTANVVDDMDDDHKYKPKLVEGAKTEHVNCTFQGVTSDDHFNTSHAFPFGRCTKQEKVQKELLPGSVSEETVDGDTLVLTDTANLAILKVGEAVELDLQPVETSKSVEADWQKPGNKAYAVKAVTHPPEARAAFEMLQRGSSVREVKAFRTSRSEATDAALLAGPTGAKGAHQDRRTARRDTTNLIKYGTHARTLLSIRMVYTDDATAQDCTDARLTASWNTAKAEMTGSSYDKLSFSNYKIVEVRAILLSNA